MLPKNYIVIVGTLFGNKTCHGPFEDFERAKEWIAFCVIKQPYEIVRLEP